LLPFGPVDALHAVQQLDRVAVHQTLPIIYVAQFWITFHTCTFGVAVQKHNE